MSPRKRVGKFNSSVTRVWPVLGALLRRDPAGGQWLTALSPRIDELSHGSILAKSVRPRDAQFGDFGNVNLPSCFEFAAEPPEAFLSWLIESAGVKWNHNFKGTSETERKRRALLSGDMQAKREALGLLSQKRARGSRGEWWAFEGFTSIDCCLETENSLLVIEGKRTESLSPQDNVFHAAKSARPEPRSR